MLVGGSVVRVPQAQGYLAEKRNLYSLDGHCRPLDSHGQGTIFGSGVGAVLLKPLHKAVAIATISLQLSKELRRITMARPKSVTPLRVWVNNRRRLLMH